MKKILYAAVALCLFASCAKETPFSANEGSGKPFSISINFQTKAGGSGDESKPKVNSIRVLVFDADASSPDGTTGKCVFNEYYPFGFTVSRKSSGGSEYYQAALTSRINISSKATKFHVYAVLNEDGYNLTSSVSLGTPDANFSGTGTNLKELLSEIDAGVSGVLETTFQSIYSQAVSYATATKVEPAFLMCAYDTDVVFTNADLTSPDPLQLFLDTSSDSGSRPMAQITIDKITTDANPAGAGTFVSDLAKVFVIGVELDNVPNSFQWDATDNVLGTNKLTSIQVSAANIITDKQGDTYYNRYWPGEVTTEVVVNASVRQETHERLYRTKNDGGTDKWNFPDLLGGDSAMKYDSYNGYTKDGDLPKNAVNAASYINYGFLTGDNFIKVDNNPDKSGKLVKVFDKDEMLENTFTVTGPSSIPGTKSGTDLHYSDDNWTVSLGDTYYVPENIQTASSNATCLKVTLAVASPELDLSEVVGSDYPQPYDFSAPSYVYGLDNVNDFKTHFSEAGKNKAQKEAMAEEVKELFQNNSHIVWYDDLDHEVTSADGHNSYAVYIDGFYRTATGSGTATVSNSQKGSVFSWNVPKTTDPEPNKVYTYIIPINNKQDGSYSILRNTRYKVTLHVTKTAYDDLLTKSAAAPGIGISAEVVTEKIDDDE